MWLPFLLSALILLGAHTLWPKRQDFMTGIAQLTIIVLAGWALSLIWTAKITQWVTEC